MARSARRLQRGRPTFIAVEVDDGAALWWAVCEHDLEGVVAKPLRSRYVPGASAAGSRRGTATTGATRWSAGAAAEAPRAAVRVVAASLP